jgi:hypothetical protein
VGAWQTLREIVEQRASGRGKCAAFAGRGDQDIAECADSTKSSYHGPVNLVSRFEVLLKVMPNGAAKY